MKYLYYSLGLLLALAPILFFALTLSHWPAPWENRVKMVGAWTGVGPEHYHDAELELRKALEDAPGNAEVHGDLGLILLGENRGPEGIAELKTALSIDPHNEMIRRRFGLALVQMGQKNQGLELLRQASVDEPGNPEGHYYYAIMLAQTGSAQQAVNEFEKALQLAPGNETIQNALNQARAALLNGTAK